jgi:hypothetical protein
LTSSVQQSICHAFFVFHIFCFVPAEQSTGWVTYTN